MKRGDDAKAELWRDRLAARAESGLSIRGFCRREGISEARFFYWQNRLAGKASREGIEGVRTEPLPGSGFVELLLADPPAEAATESDAVSVRGVEVRFRCGASLCIDKADGALLTHLVEVLARC
jgi:hypothetical protein